MLNDFILDLFVNVFKILILAGQSDITQPT